MNEHAIAGVFFKRGMFDIALRTQRGAAQLCKISFWFQGVNRLNPVAVQGAPGCCMHITHCTWFLMLQ